MKSKILLNKIKPIIESVVGKISSSLFVESNNHVYILQAESKKYLCKIYNHKGYFPDFELNVYNIIPTNPYVRKLIFSDETKNIINYNFAIFEFIEGVTLDELLEQERFVKTKEVAHQVFEYINLFQKVPTKGFGILSKDLTGKHIDWFNYQLEVLIDSLHILIKKGFPYKFSKEIFRLLYKYENSLFISSPTLVPIDLNLKNLIISNNSVLKIIDIGTVISGDIFNSYGEFIAHSYGTNLGDTFLIHFSNEKDIFKIRLYALLDDINILSFIAKHDGDIASAKPWGNPNSFFDLITLHIEYLQNES